MDQCLNDTYCYHLGESCIMRKCQCKQNFMHNEKQKRCIQFVCQSDDECHSYDEHRMCQAGDCTCQSGFSTPIEQGHMCLSNSINHFKNCSSYKDCGPFERCVDSVCQCQYNYLFNYSTQRCEFFDCRLSETKCQTSFDNYLNCDFNKGLCYCPDGYHQDHDNGDKCIDKITMKNGISNDWIAMIIIGGVFTFFLFVYFSILIIRKIIRNEPQQPTIIIHENLQDVIISPRIPPPPYSTI